MKAPIFGVEIPGFLFWVAVLYACVATGITQLIGRNLSRLYFRQQAVEANFRFDLARIREYSEQIALLKGEDAGDRPRGERVRRGLPHHPAHHSCAHVSHRLQPVLQPDLRHHSLCGRRAVLLS